MAAMLHSGGGSYNVNHGGNGCITKKVEYSGKASHAAYPQGGINALYAANLGLQAINALRETFNDEDHTRVHPIITEGGQAVNIIPNRVTMESYVRGATVSAIETVNTKVNRALAASAAALGAQVSIHDRPGYMPLHNDATMIGFCAETMAEFMGGEAAQYISSNWSTGCTDMGDISCIMPVVHPHGGGGKGTGHGVDFGIADKEFACVMGAKIMTGLLCRLLGEGAEGAQQVLEHKDVPYASKQDYLDMMDHFYADIDCVEYEESGNITLKYTKEGN